MYRSCRDVPASNGDGEYSIDPTLSGNPFTVYCDMATDGGIMTSLSLCLNSKMAVSLFEKAVKAGHLRTNSSQTNCNENRRKKSS